MRKNVKKTEKGDEDYEILVQGRAGKLPAIIFRKKHRGRGATIKTISKNGQHSDLYAEYESVVRASQERRDNRTNPTTRPIRQDSPEMVREEWVSKTVRSVVEGQKDDQGNSSGV